MYTATDTQTHEAHSFRKIDALVKRLGGDHFQVEHDTANRPPNRFLLVLKSNRKVGGSDVVARIKINADEWDQICADEDERN
jgi:hypothetical protein